MYVEWFLLSREKTMHRIQTRSQHYGYSNTIFGPTMVPLYVARTQFLFHHLTGSGPRVWCLNNPAMKNQCLRNRLKFKGMIGDNHQLLTSWLQDLPRTSNFTLGQVDEKKCYADDHCVTPLWNTLKLWTIMHS